MRFRDYEYWKTRLAARVEPIIVFSAAKIDFGTPSLSCRDKSGVFPCFLQLKTNWQLGFDRNRIFFRENQFRYTEFIVKKIKVVYPLVPWRFSQPKKIARQFNTSPPPLLPLTWVYKLKTLWEDLFWCNLKLLILDFISLLPPYGIFGCPIRSRKRKNFIWSTSY